VVVAPTVVLTAAHCGASITRVMVGGNKVLPSTDPGARLVAVRAVRIHPHFGGHPGYENDLSVLILSSQAGVQHVPLVTAKQLSAAEELELVGFGYNDPQRPLGFGEKRRARVPLCPVKGDLGNLPQALGFYPDYELVAGRKGLGKDTCNGDSGGPAYVPLGGDSYALVGITSRPTREATVNCGDGGVYVRPDKFRVWINEVLASFGLAALPA
jgi:endonuclease G